MLPVVCRKTALDTVSIHGLKRRFIVSADDTDHRVDTVVDLMDSLFEGVERSRHPIEAGLNETNFILHPCIALLNTGYILGDEPWRFYRQGLSAPVGNLVEAVDLERQALLARLGLEPVALTRWLADFYGHQGMEGDSLYEMMYNFAPFAESPGPRSLTHRYFSEDIPFGLVPMSSLARQLDVNVPLTDALIDLACRLCGENFRTAGRDLAGFTLEAV